SSHVDRSVSTDDSELSVESLIKNLKNIIMKKLLILYVTESSVFSSAFSVSFSATFSQSSTPVPVPGFSLTTSVLTILTSITSGFTVSAFVISSSHFKEILYRLNESYLSAILIEDDNITETIFFCSQASLITFSLFSAEKVVCISDHKHSALSDFHCYLSDSASSSSSVSSASTLSALTSDS
ncbi:hypothetical protein BDFG_02587, partial [Blastomyces dermatitidis ATCC 26199]